MRRLKKLIGYAIVIGIVVFIAIQFVPTQAIEKNPPKRASLGAPPEVEAIMRRACMDCHSNETRWPFYVKLAPGKWLMIRDVKKGREHMNFSEWADADAEERALDRKNAWEQVESGAMPKWFYVYPMHLDARLSDAEKAKLKAWMLGPPGATEGEAPK